MKQLLLIPVLVSLSACHTAGTEETGTNAVLRSDLTPAAFGSEQTMMAGINAGVSFDHDHAGRGGLGTIEVRGETVAVLRDDSGPEPSIAIDSNRNAEFENEEFRAGVNTEHVIRFGKEQVTVTTTNGETGSEYTVRELWKARFDLGGEVLALGALRFGLSSIGFADDDLDGVYESFITPDNPIWLAGRAWDLDIDFRTRSALLRATDRAPVAAGFAAPCLDAGDLESGEPVPLIVEGNTTVLLFCHPECAGCKLIGDALTDLRDTYDDDSVRWLSVGRTPREALDNRDLVCPTYDHVVSDEAWSAYAVRPTPTLIVIDADGVITYRGPGAGGESDTLLRNKIEESRGRLTGVNVGQQTPRATHH